MTLSRKQKDHAQRLRDRTLWFAAYSAGCVALFWHPLRNLLQLALSSDTDSHILIVPLLSVALLWMFRTQIFKDAALNWKAFAAFGFAGLTLSAIYWRLGARLPARESLEIAILSLCCFLFAGFALTYGEKGFRAGIFPLFLLLLAVPIPEFVLDRLTWWLQLGSAEVTGWFFHLSGTPVLRQGLFFSVPGVTIEIAKECSGIRSTLALLIACLLAGYLLLWTAWARVALLLSTLPVLVLKNGIRIVTLTLLSIYVDPSFLHGRLHRDGGVVFFIIGLVILMPVLFWLQRLEHRKFGAGKFAPSGILSAEKTNHSQAQPIASD